ncbi:MAG TPA: hypothetical protein VNO34_01875 [Actinomycetota bacterium]|nr:hypothetical protein [Actinomycetota bacterium]
MTGGPERTGGRGALLRGPLRWAPGAALLLGAVSLALPAAPARAVSIPYPERPDRLTVNGFQQGRAGKGQTVHFVVTADDPKGFAHLRTVSVRFLVREQPIQEIVFFVDEGTVGLAGRKAVPPQEAGPADAGFFVFHARGARFVRSTFAFKLIVSVTFLEPLPPDSAFRAFAVDDDGRVAMRKRPLEQGPALLSWGTFGLAAGAALFVGALAGSALASRRHRQQEPSIWDIVERRIREERARPPAALRAWTGGGAP